ncbi:hypothetical protein [Ketobacter sp.]|uniref:hypothetical protein n=1 Tax=Ketobacter sp. TaxID=2083498 RepID=UPI000F2495CC|nr:hypothetical protein [Ketobacter sp.]RLT92239.1 MAG: hypothetical protein D9N14_22270 [Ketobacter sp.]
MKQPQLYNDGQQHSFWQRLVAFANIIYEPRQHFLFAALWFLSIQGLFVLNSPATTWHWNISTLISAGSFFGVLFVLRAIDEVKDLEYDRQYNPERPLVSGVVSLADIRHYVVMGTLLIALANGLIAWPLALFVVLNIGYGLLLMLLEKALPLMERSLFFNLLLTYPVSIALSVYTLLQIRYTQQVDVVVCLLPIILCYILAFLHFEIIRKSMWEPLADPGEKLYSNEIGCRQALLLGSLCGVLAIAGIILLNRPWHLHGAAAITGWLPLLGLIWIGLSVRLFLTRQTQRFNPRQYSVPFIVSFYLLNLVHASVANSIQWSWTLAGGMEPEWIGFEWIRPEWIAAI